METNNRSIPYASPNRNRSLEPEIRSDVEAYARIKVVGVGGGGCNAVNRMIEEGVKGIEFITVNTDSQALNASKAPIKIHIGPKTTNGLEPVVIPRLARNQPRNHPKNCIGCSKAAIWYSSPQAWAAAPVPALHPSSPRLPKKPKHFTIGVVTRPFTLKETNASSPQKQGIARLKEHADTLIVIPNDRLLQMVDRKASLQESFKTADDVLRQGIQGISE